MDQITVDVSGEMSPPPVQPKLGVYSYLQLPNEFPNPQDWITKQRQNIRPWLLFVQTSNFKPPPSVPRLSKRIMRNIEYFQSNYVFVFLGLFLYCLITSPLVLIAIAGSFYAGYKLSKRHQEKKFILFNRELTLAQQYGLVAICSFPVYYLVGAHAALFWVLGASFVVITLHAAFYNIDALAPDEATFGLTQEV